MRHVVTQSVLTASREQSPSKWAYQLPSLCCQAAGGESHWADSVAVAWFLFQTAAHALDTVEDNDASDTIPESFPPSVVINLATGLIFIAFSILEDLYNEEYAHHSANFILKDFHRYLMLIVGGQHLDLSITEPTTQEWWKIAEAKGGAPFALANRAGAWLATEDRYLIDQYGLYGHHLGMIVQILDDTSDLFTDLQSDKIEYPKHWSLPIAYAVEVLPSKKQTRLRYLLTRYRKEPLVTEEIVDLVINSGAAIYIDTLIEQERQNAVNVLNLVNSQSPAVDSLRDILDNLIATSRTS